ncbi:MAG: hypothetical protein U9R08_01065 [Nanoarchaeota archaeon]|nr:hypothetical protein [Nanoarchaeota archaeon]
MNKNIILTLTVAGVVAITSHLYINNELKELNNILTIKENTITSLTSYNKDLRDSNNELKAQNDDILKSLEFEISESKRLNEEAIQSEEDMVAMGEKFISFIEKINVDTLRRLEAIEYLTK